MDTHASSATHNNDLGTTQRKMMGASNPAWLDNAIFYQVYPQSFCDSNGDGIGDLPGLISKLDYIRSLGCNGLWLNPCFVSPFKDAGYDVADFLRVAPRYGTNDDLLRLFREARERGIRVCLDLVAGHTSDQHPWFIESASGNSTRLRNRYIWTRDWLEGGGDGLLMQHGNAERNGNYAVNFFACQPALNYGFGQPDPGKPWQLPVDHPEVVETRAELRRIMKFWLDAGAAGFRVDMAPSLVKNDPDKVATSALWREVRHWLDREYPEAVLISEWGNAPKALAAGFHIDFLFFCGTTAYTALFRSEPERHIFSHVDPALFYEGEADPSLPAHSFFDRSGAGDITRFLGTYCDHLARTSGLGHMAIPSGNHDMPRLAHHRTPEELAVVFAFLLTMPGVPFIYYGDEIGMRHREDLVSKEGGFTRTGARTPMQWDSGANAGFSDAPGSALYLPVDSAPGAPNVAAMEADPGSLLHLVRKLTALRREHPALAANGGFRPVHAVKNACPFVYLRESGTDRVCIALNPGENPVAVALPPECGAARPLLASRCEMRSKGGEASLEMGAFSYWIAQGG